MGLTVFSLAGANILFLLGLGLYVRVRRGWALAWAAGGGLAMLAPAGWESLAPATDDRLSATGPAVWALACAALASRYYCQSRIRPDRASTGHLLIAQAVCAASAAVFILLTNWPLRF